MKVKGRKRHLVVDTFGLLLAVSVTAASVQDRDGAHPVTARAKEKYPSVQQVFVDSAYAGQCAQIVSQRHGIQVQVVRHPAKKNVGRWAGRDGQPQRSWGCFCPLPTPGSDTPRLARVKRLPPADIDRLLKGHPEVKGLTVDTGTAQEIRLGLDGMTCGSFVAWVEQTIGRRPGSRPPRPTRRRRPLQVSHLGCYNQAGSLQPEAWWISTRQRGQGEARPYRSACQRPSRRLAQVLPEGWQESRATP